MRTMQVIARTGSFSRAGRELFLTQPAISQRVREIEKMFGVELFRRTRGRQGGLQLTDAGERVLKFAQEMLDAYERLCSDVGTSEEDQVSELTVAIPGPDAAGRMTNMMLGGLSNEASRIRLDLVFMNHSDIVGAVRTGRVDVGLVAGGTTEEMLTSIPAWEHRWIAAVSPRHQSICNWRNNLEPGTRIPMVIPSPETYVRGLLNDWASTHRVVIDPIMECRFVEPIKNAALAGVGPCVVLEDAVAHELTTGALVPLTTPGLPIEYQVSVVYLTRRAATPAIRGVLRGISAHSSGRLA